MRVHVGFFFQRRNKYHILIPICYVVFLLQKILPNTFIFLVKEHNKHLEITKYVVEKFINIYLHAKNVDVTIRKLRRISCL